MAEVLPGENLGKGDSGASGLGKPGKKGMAELLLQEIPGKGDVLRENLGKGSGRASAPMFAAPGGSSELLIRDVRA